MKGDDLLAYRILQRESDDLLLDAEQRFVSLVHDFRLFLHDGDAVGFPRLNRKDILGYSGG